MKVSQYLRDVLEQYNRRRKMTREQNSRNKEGEVKAEKMGIKGISATCDLHVIGHD